jgi:CubicO group peptidase (beta-lactamase class C family)
MISPIFNPLLLISSVLFIHATFIPSVAGQRKENTTTIVDNQSAKVFLTSLPKALEKVRADGGIKGMSVAIVHKGELVFAQGFGKRNRNDPFTKEVS